jgi:hypothetical protein
MPYKSLNANKSWEYVSHAVFLHGPPWLQAARPRLYAAVNFPRAREGVFDQLTTVVIITMNQRLQVGLVAGQPAGM